MPSFEGCQITSWSQGISSLDERERYLLQKEKSLDQQTADLRAKLNSVDDLYRKQLEKLETISGLDIEKAKQLVISSTEKKMSSWIAKKIEEARDQIRQKEEEITKEVIVDNIRHGVTDYVAEYTVSTISLADEAIKGKIIGREGRNIRAFEKATGVELEVLLSRHFDVDRPLVEGSILDRRDLGCVVRTAGRPAVVGRR